jgi:hypothetical protein
MESLRIEIQLQILRIDQHLSSASLSFGGGVEKTGSMMDVDRERCFVGANWSENRSS